MEIGEYIRTQRGKIAKIKVIKETKYTWRSARAKGDEKLSGTKRILINGKYETEDIKRHSFNELDLLEEGDVIKVIENEIISVVNFQDKEEIKVWREDIEKGVVKVLSIVTREQFESIEYKMEE